MKLSLKWTEEILGSKITVSPESLADQLLLRGFECAAIERFDGCPGVVTAIVHETKPHPKADRLRIVKVSDGKETLDVVCGAPNVAAGQCVLWAKVGSVIAGGKKVSEAEIRGVVSPGMLCSVKELGIGEDHSGIWILPENTLPGQSADDFCWLQDTILDMEITPNRPDALSVIGLAREIAAILNFPLPQREAEPAPKLGGYSVSVENAKDCPLYIARKFENFSVGESLPRMKTVLSRCGIRSINNLVDITNFVLLELGQPLHVFDADKLEGGCIVVRRAKAGEKILALDGKTYSLSPDELIIADAKNPVAIAGVMGGEASAVTAVTRNVLLESAVFDRALVRRARTKLNLSSESSYRFERGVSRWSARTGSSLAADFIVKSSGANECAYGAAGNLSGGSGDVLLSGKSVSKILGEPVQLSEISESLTKTGVPVKGSGADTLTVRAPEWRLDLEIVEDFVEEIARVRGYDNTPPSGTWVQLPVRRTVEPQSAVKEKVRQILTALGFCESINYGLIPQKSAELFKSHGPFVEVDNPLSEDQSLLRPSLLPELLRNVRTNLSYKKSDVRLFEIGTAFHRSNGAVSESMKLAGVACGSSHSDTWQDKNKGRALDFYWMMEVVKQIQARTGARDLAFTSCTEDIFHPNFCLSMTNASGQSVGFFGLIHPLAAKPLDLPDTLVFFELDIAGLCRSISGGKKLHPVLRTPSIERDCAVWVASDIPWGKIESAVRETGGELLESVRLFDLYREPSNPDMKSFAFTCTFRHPSKTLEDQEANTLRDKIADDLQLKFKAEMRRK